MGVDPRDPGDRGLCLRQKQIEATEGLGLMPREYMAQRIGRGAPRGGGQAAGRDRRCQCRDLRVEIDGRIQPKHSRKENMIGFGARGRERGGQDLPVEAAQGDGDMDVIAMGIGVAGGNPGAGIGRQVYPPKLGEDDPGPEITIRFEACGEGERDMQEAMISGQLLESAAQVRRTAEGHGAADQLGSGAEIISVEEARIAVGLAMGAHRYPSQSRAGPGRDGSSLRTGGWSSR